MSRTQKDVYDWSVGVFGPLSGNLEERALRMLEEALEVAQSAGVPKEVAERLKDNVYARPVGDISQELAGCLLTLESTAEAAKIDLTEATILEWSRIQKISLEEWKTRVIDKRTAGVTQIRPEDVGVEG